MTSIVLLPFGMAVPVYVAEEIAVGRSVFQNFVHEEFEVEGVPDEILEEVPEEEILEEDIVSDRNANARYYEDENFSNAMEHVGRSSINARMVSQVGANIRELANEFARSRERQRLREEADKVDLATITYSEFFVLMEEVFRQGITRERVVALFFFCADVIIKCARCHMKDIGIRLFKWGLQYIVDRVCSWVAKHGGWENVIKNSLTSGQKVAIGAAAVGIVAVSGFILYKWNT